MFTALLHIAITISGFPTAQASLRGAGQRTRPAATRAPRGSAAGPRYEYVALSLRGASSSAFSRWWLLVFEYPTLAISPLSANIQRHVCGSITTIHDIVQVMLYHS